MKEKVNIKEKLSVRNIALMGMLIAVEIVLERLFSISTPITRIGFSFIAPVCAAIVLGPIESAIVYAVGDMLGMILFPSGAILWGLTLTKAIKGIVWGVALNKKASLPRIIGSEFIVQFILSWLVDSYFLLPFYGGSYTVVLGARFIQSVLLFAVQSAVIVIFQEALFKRIKLVFAANA